MLEALQTPSPSSGDRPLQRIAAVDSRHGTRPLAARTLWLDPGEIDLDRIVDDPGGWLGLLVMDGLMVVGLGAGRGDAGWLIGKDDLIRPWEMNRLCLLDGHSWRVVTPTRLALLDRKFVLRAQGDPAVWNWSLSRLAQTSHWLLAKTRVMCSPHIIERLALVFTLLSERWGKVTPEGIRLDVPLTHALLAQLVGARRPSVSVAIKTLEARGFLVRTAQRRYLLRRRDPSTQPAVIGDWDQCMLALGL